LFRRAGGIAATFRLRFDTISHVARQSLNEYFENFWRNGEQCAYVQSRGYRKERWSYRQVAMRASQFARELEARGIAKGDRILVWGPNSADWVAVFLGCALRGAVAVPMDHIATAEFSRKVFDQVGARLTLCSRDHQQGAGHELIFDDLTKALDQHSEKPYLPVEMKPEDPLQIIFTSGTTAEPKGVVITHGNVLANIEPLETEISKYLKYERFVHPVRFLNLLPLSHVFGQFLGIFLPQFMAGTVIFQDTLKPAEVVRTIRKERVSVLVAVPRMLQSLKEKIERDLEDSGKGEWFRHAYSRAEGKHFLRRWWTFRRIRREFGWKFWAFISGGATLDRVTEEFWDRLGYAAIQGYGLTETTSIVSVNHPFRLGKGSIGKVLAGREVKLAPDGEILVRGGGVAPAYWNRGQATPLGGAQGWYGTGDIGEIDAAGNLYFKGRKKDVIVTSAGMNVYPEDLEAALRRQPGVKDCVVVSIPRGGNAEPNAVLILDAGTAADDVVRQANQQLAEYQKIRFWFVWPDRDFPRTSTQKPRLNAIRETVLSTGPAASSPLSELISRIKGQRVGIFPDANLEADLNLSSLDRVELLAALEEKYQVDLSETCFSAVNTVGDLERALRGEVPARVRYHYPRFAQRWPVTWIRRVTDYVLLMPAVFLLGWPKIEGRDHLRVVKGPALVICNHIGDVDLGFVRTALPDRVGRRLATATGGEALEALRTPPCTKNKVARAYDRLKWILGVSLLNLFPLPREAGFRESFQFAGDLVDRGYNVLVFPEGRHTEDGKIRQFRSGIGLLAHNLKIPIIPMRIDGLFELKRAGKRFARPHAIRVKIGKPITFPDTQEPQSIARELQQIVEQL